MRPAAKTQKVSSAVPIRSITVIQENCRNRLSPIAATASRMSVAPVNPIISFSMPPVIAPMTPPGAMGRLALMV